MSIDLILFLDKANLFRFGNDALDKSSIDSILFLCIDNSVKLSHFKFEIPSNDFILLSSNESFCKEGILADDKKARLSKDK